MSSLQLYLLGPLDIRSGGHRLPRPPASKSQSLLAYLALYRGQPQPRDRLVGIFWPEQPERNARHSLSTALWHIRRCLSDDSALLTDAHGVQLDGHIDLWLDVAEFETRVSRADVDGLQSALTLYRGELLEGFYDDWILGERYRLEALYLEALARLMAAQEIAGDQQAALATAHRLLARDPLREDAHRLAMRACCRLGRRNEALEQYDRCRAIVRAEVGAEPVGETAALRRAILSGAFPVGPVPDALPAARLPGAGVPPAGSNPPEPAAPALRPGSGPVRLAGRERELEVLQDAWRAARSGHGDLILISGEAGVGKTRLVDELVTRLRPQGARVLCGRCYELERALPHQPFAEALHNALPDLSDAELGALPDWVRTEMARLVPEMQERRVWSAGEGRVLSGGIVPRRPGPGGPGLDQDQLRLFEGVSHILAALSSRAPLLLVLEDLHWAGDSTIGLVHHLARHRALAGHCVLIAGTFRPEATGEEHPLRSLWRRLAREGLVRPLCLARLSAAAVEGMIANMSGAGEAVLPLARRLYRETEGNPFFLMEHVRALFEANALCLEEGVWQGDFAGVSAGALPLPAGVREAIQARIRRLDQATREALGLAAVIGREFDFELLNAAWGRGEEATLQALEGLLRGQLIEEGAAAGDRDFAFTHRKIQEVVYEALPRSRRLSWHAHVGQAIESLYAAELEARAGELAYHFEQACRADRSLCEKAVAYLLPRAGRRRAGARTPLAAGRPKPVQSAEAPL